MNRIIFAICLLVLSLGITVWVTLFVLSTNNPVLGTSDSLANLVEKITPSIVSITGSTTDGITNTHRTGTGIIIDASGIILTNKHLISEWFTYSIELDDGTKTSAKLLKVHPTLDLALLSIISEEPLTLATWTFINSQASVRQGDRIIAIGNTLGLYTGSVTEGIISGLDRTVSFGGITMNWLIQTSIPMSLGNSGWPLVTIDGSIIGINTGIVGGSSQIGWTLPLTQEEVDSFLK